MLCVAVMLSVMVLGAGAAFSDQDKIENTEAVEMATALKIIDGYEDGSYHPERNIKRSEMCKMICIALNGGKVPATSTKDDPTFSDIDGHWAEGYIEYCYTEGVVSGVGGGRFNPDGNVTVTQAAKMLLVALGYNADVEQFNGGNWSLYVNVKANQDGIYKDLEGIDTASALTRDDAAQMIWNAMQAYIINKQSSIDVTTGDVTEHYVKSETTTMLMKKYNSVVKQGYLTGFTYDEVKGEWDYTFDAGANFGGKAIDANKAIGSYDEAGHYYTKTLTSSTDYTGLYGQKVKVVYDVDDNDTVYGVYAYDSSIMTEFASGDMDKAPDDSARTVKISGTNYKMDSASTAIGVYDVNGGADIAANLNALYNAQLGYAYTAKLVDNTGDGKADAVITTPMTVAQITYVGSDTVTFNNGVNVKNKDDLAMYDGYAQGDWVYFIPGDNASTCMDTAVKAELKTSTVDAIRGSSVATGYTDFKLNGEWFAETTDNSYSVATAEVNDTIEYVTLGGVVFYAKITDVAATTKNIAMIITADAVRGEGVSNNLGDTVIKAKLLLADGTETTVTVDKVTTITNSVSSSKDVTALTDLNAYYGQLVTYRVNSDGNYELTLVNADNKAGYKSYQNGAAYSNKTIAGAELADDATVFVLIDADYATTKAFAAANDGETYTGKEFKNAYGTGTFGIAGTGYALVAMEDGFNYAKVAMVVATAEPVINTGSNYGYLTEVANRTVENDKTYLNVTMWTKDGEKTAKFESTDAPATYKKGAVITYDDKGDGEIKNVSLVSLIDAAVTGWSESTGKIQLSTGLSSEVDTKDTTVIYVDSKNGVGAEGGKIQLGQDRNNDDVADVNNVRYLGNSTVLDLLIVDVNNLMYANPVSGKLVPTAGMSAADIKSMVETELKNFNTTTADLSAITNAPSIDVKAGQTLTIDGLSANAKATVNLESGASLNVSTADLKNLTVNVASGADVTVNGAKLAGTGAALTGTTALSVDATGAITATGVTAVDTTKLGTDKVKMSASGLTLNSQALGTVLTSYSGDITVSKGTLSFSAAPTIADGQTLTFNGTIIGADPAGTAITLAHSASGGKLALNGVEFTTSGSSDNTVTFDKDGAVSAIGANVTVTGTTATSAVNVSSTTAVTLAADTDCAITATLANGGKVTADSLTYTAGANGATVKLTDGATAVDVTGTLTVAAASASKTINVNSGTLTAATPSASNTLTVNLKSGAALVSGTETYTAVTDSQVTVAHTSGDVTLVSGSVKLSNGAVIGYDSATFTATSANDVVALNGTTVTTTGAVGVDLTNVATNGTVVKATKGVITLASGEKLTLDNSNTTEVIFTKNATSTVTTAAATAATTVVLSGNDNATSTWVVTLGANTTFVGASSSAKLTITNGSSTAGAGGNFYTNADKTVLNKTNDAGYAATAKQYQWRTDLGATGSQFSGWWDDGV